MMVAHNKNIDDVRAALAKECRGLSSAKTIAYLLERGLLSHTHAKAYLAKQRVGQMVARGVAKVEAIEAVAKGMGCSPATIRNYVYNNYK